MEKNVQVKAIAKDEKPSFPTNFQISLVSGVSKVYGDFLRDALLENTDSKIASSQHGSTVTAPNPIALT